MLYQTLQKHFGFTTFRNGQEQVIQTLVNGNSAAAIFPTGSGKSLCYQLAALMLPDLTLVVSPLLALISDQIESMHNNSISAARIDSTLKPDEINTIRQKIKGGEIKVLMVSVERFKNENFRQFLSGISISMMVVDEAHCISEWGHNFRPDYIKLPGYRDQFKIPQVLLLTATATKKVINDMCAKFSINPQNVVVTGFYRPNLHLSVVPVNEKDKKNELVKLLEPVKNESSIVYVTLQKTSEDVAQFLRDNGISAAAYHAGMGNVEREFIQNGFMNCQTPVIVATIAFGMGIDKSDIRSVIHYDLPKSIESYSQEIGRSGRDGKISKCYVLGNLDSVNILENFIFGDTPEIEGLEMVFNNIFKNDNTWDLQINKLSSETNIRQLPLKTLLVYLEIEGIIQPLYSYFSSYRFKNILPNDEIISKFTGERQLFVKAIFDNSQKARLWTTVNFESITTNYSTDRRRIAAALDYFFEQGFIELQAKNLVDVFKIKLVPGNKKEMIEKMHLRFIEKEKIEIERIQEMIKFFSGDCCLSKTLSLYFGEKHEWENCGVCSYCTSGSSTLKKTIELPQITKNEITEFIDIIHARTNKNLSSTTITRFLCGIYTPVFTSLKITELNGYGAFENYRYNDVKSIVKSIIT